LIDMYYVADHSPSTVRSACAYR